MTEKVIRQLAKIKFYNWLARRLPKYVVMQCAIIVFSFALLHKKYQNKTIGDISALDCLLLWEARL